MYNHILVPVAPDHINDCSLSLDAASRLLADGGTVSVLSVLEELPSYIGSYFPAEQVQKSVSEFEERLGIAVEASNISTHVVTGHPTNSILDWAEKHKADCIIVASHQPGLSDYLIGSTAARVVRHAQCSVVVLRGK